MAYRLRAHAARGNVASRGVRPCPATRPSAQQSHSVDADGQENAWRCAAVMFLSAGLICGQAVVPESVMATVQISKSQAAAAATIDRTGPLLSLPPLPQPLASAATAAAVTTFSGGAATAAVAVMEEAEELVMDVVHIFQHGIEAVESTVHHLQVVHALERLEELPLNQVVDLELLKAAMHPESSSSSSPSSMYGIEYEEVGSSSVGSDAAQRLDAALDSVAQWRLRDVVDVGKLADALQDVQYSGPLDSRALRREAIRLRRTVHWDVVAEAVRPPQLRQALTGLGASRRFEVPASPFSDLDILTAVSAVRMDTVRNVLSPPKPASQQQPSHTLESSGMWTWESM